MSAPRVGVALDERVLIARELSGAREVHRIELGGSGTPDRASLSAALTALRERLDVETSAAPDSPIELGVALLSPLAHFRVIDLPPLVDAEVEALLERDASRYFPGGAARRVVAVQPRSERTGAVRAVAASAELLHDLVLVSRDLGFRLGAITTGWHAWAAGAGPTRLAVARRGELQVLVTESGRPSRIRRAPLDGSGSWIALAEAEEVTLIGEEPDTTRVREALEARAIRVRHPAAGSGAAEFAARHVFATDVRLLPEALRAERTARERRRGVRMLIAAAVLVALAVAVQVVGLQRQLDGVREARAELAPDVSPLLVLRDSLAALNDEVAAVREVSGRSHDWTTALSELALLLPVETWVTSLTGAEGDLEFEAAGERAGESIDALRAARSLSGVRLDGLVERELENGETVVERFRLGARVRLRKVDRPAISAGGPGGGRP